MLSFPAAIKVYLCTVPCHMRRSFDGLSMMAEHVIGCNPYTGHLLAFSNRRTDRVKILYWDRGGWAIWYKRLGLDPFAYLRDIFEGIGAHPQSRLAELLPDQWMAANRSAATS